MAGKVVADQIEDSSANVGSTTDMIKGSARALVNFNGTGVVAIRKSYNVASITDLGTGHYTINFASSMPDNDYIAVGSCIKGDTNDDGNINVGLGGNGTTYDTKYAPSGFDIWCSIGSAISVADSPTIVISVFR